MVRDSAPLCPGPLPTGRFGGLPQEGAPPHRQQPQQQGHGRPMNGALQAFRRVLTATRAGRQQASAAALRD